MNHYVKTFYFLWENKVKKKKICQSPHLSSPPEKAYQYQKIQSENLRQLSLSEIAKYTINM